MGAFKKNFKALLLAMFAIIYLISPIDLIPDFILILGQLDDIGILIGSILYGQKAISVMVWGDKTVNKRFSTFALWLLTFVTISWVIKFGIFMYYQS